MSFFGPSERGDERGVARCLSSTLLQNCIALSRASSAGRRRWGRRAGKKREKREKKGYRRQPSAKFDEEAEGESLAADDNSSSAACR